MDIKFSSFFISAIFTVLLIACSGNKDNGLIKSIKKNNKKAVYNALKNKINLNMPDKEGLSPLYIASKYGNPEIIKLLLENGATVDFKNIGGETALHSAVANNNTKSVKILLEYSANVNAETEKDKITPLMIASSLLNYEIVKLLVEHGARINGRTRDNTPVITFCLYMKNNAKVLDYLLRKGADPNFIDESDNSPIIMYAVNAANISSVKALIKYGALINVQNSTGDTALMTACRNRSLEKVKLLLKHKADVNLRDKNNETALTHAKRAGSAKIASLLEKNGAVE